MIFIPFQKKFDGGVSTFMRNFHRYLSDRQYPFQHKPYGASGIFFPIHYHDDTLAYIKKRGGYVVQRLDGIYYPEKHGDGFGKLNAPIKKIYREYANHVVFQSEYSRRQCFEFLGGLDDEKYSIIVNGVNKSVFGPGQKQYLSTPIRLITTGVFRNVDMVEPVILAVDSLHKKYSVELHLVGPVTHSDLKHYLSRPYVKSYTIQKGEEMADTLKNADVFIYSHLNPPCPNSVIEAISCGLPVVGFDSGAMAELCYFSKDLLAPVVSKVFHQYDDFEPQLLAEKVVYAIENFAMVKQRAMDYSHLYSFEACGAAYCELFDSLGMMESPWMERVGADSIYLLSSGKQKVRRLWKKLAR